MCSGGDDIAISIVAAALARPSLLVDAKEIAEHFGRAPRGVDHVRVPAWDEDATTLALDAASEALRAAREPAGGIRTLVVCGEIDAATLVVALGLERAKLRVAGGSALDALDLAFAGEAPALLVSAIEPGAAPGTEARIEEGAAGVALMLKDGAGVALASSASSLSPASDDDASAAALELAASRLAPPSGAPAFVAGSQARAWKGVKPAIDARKDWGDLGMLSPLVSLVETLRAGLGRGAWCLAADARDGRATLLALQASGPVVVAPPPERARRVGPVRALQEGRAFASGEAIPDSPMGAYVPWGTWVEDLPARLRLLAQRCDACGKTAYPPRGACPACRGRAFADVALPPRAVVYSATRIGRGGAPSEFASEQAQTGAYWVGVVEWPESGVRVTARLAGYDEHGPAIGDSVRAVVRRLFEQEGRVRYGVKFAAV